MLLAIDVGNTNVVFAVVDQTTVKHRWRISTQHNRTSDDYMVWLHQLFLIAGIDRASVNAAIIATVVPQTTFNLRKLCRDYLRLDARVVGQVGLDLGLKINMPNPSEVGADRLVNAVAAHASYKGALIVVDFGTATTFDVIAADGSYQGGIISPGINLSMDALYNAAAKLPRIAIEPPNTENRVIGKSTVEAMQSGVFWGYVGLIEGLIARIKHEMTEPMTVIATGGLATLFERHTSFIDSVAPDLTIQGLALIHVRN